MDRLLVRDELLSKARQAKSILEADTPYKTAKSLISSIFESPLQLPPLALVKLRLTVIDSFYGTNMSKRYYGVDDIAAALNKIASEDTSLRSRFLGVAEACASVTEVDSQIASLFTRTFGLTKKGSPAGRAGSLISKYAYFLCKYQFPIYDSLAVKTCRVISIRYPELDIPSFRSGDAIGFFRAVAHLNRLFEDFDLLDNLLWLFGKVREGNLSLVLHRDRFLMLRAAQPLGTDKDLFQVNRTQSRFREAVGMELSSFIEFVAVSL